MYVYSQGQNYHVIAGLCVCVCVYIYIKIWPIIETSH